MKKKLVGFFVISITLIFFAPHFSFCQEVNINIKKAQINGENICDIKVDNFTDILGRPNDIDTDDPEIIGNALRYYDQGLKFNFFGSDFGDKEKVQSFAIYVSEWEDLTTKKSYEIFEGNLSPEVDQDTKIGEMAKIIDAKDYKIVTPDERRKMLKETLVGGVDPDQKYRYYFHKKYEDFELRIAFEEFTKFAQYIIVACK